MAGVISVAIISIAASGQAITICRQGYRVAEIVTRDFSLNILTDLYPSGVIPLIYANLTKVPPRANGNTVTFC